MVNAGLDGIGLSGLGVASAFDNIAKGLDITGAVIDSAVTVGEAGAALTGIAAGGFISLPTAGVGGVVTEPIGAATMLGLYELNPVVRGAILVGNGLATLSTALTASSDVISGETNTAGTLSLSGNELYIENNTTIGRDTVTSAFLTGAGWISPLGVTSAPLAWAAVANDFDVLYIGPFSEIPKALPVTNFKAKVK